MYKKSNVLLNAQGQNRKGTFDSDVRVLVADHEGCVFFSDSAQLKLLWLISIFQKDLVRPKDIPSSFHYTVVTVIFILP